MDNKDDIDLVTAFKKMLAENKSLQARLEEYAATISSRDNEIAMLQTMLAEADEYRSGTDNQLKELEGLQFYVNDLKQQVAGSVYMATGRQQQAGSGVSMEQQLEGLRKDYADLQSQLTGLQTQLLDVSSRNLQLQQKCSRVAELESLLANTEQERDWKDKQNPFPEK